MVGYEVHSHLLGEVYIFECKEPVGKLTKRFFFLTRGLHLQRRKYNIASMHSAV